MPCYLCSSYKYLSLTLGQSTRISVICSTSLLFSFMWFKDRGPVNIIEFNFLKQSILFKIFTVYYLAYIRLSIKLSIFIVIIMSTVDKGLGLVCVVIRRVRFLKRIYFNRMQNLELFLSECNKLYASQLVHIYIQWHGPFLSLF